jgi:hypothetical protein
MTTNRLQTIATRQSKSFARDLLFSALVALAAVVSITSVATAAEAANNSAAQSQITHR